MRYKDGRFYEGEWRNDYREGPGCERYSDFSFYKGFFLKGKNI